METLKAGTRCECRDPNCPHEGENDTQGRQRGEPDAFRCRLVAVRAVTVVGKGNFEPVPGYEKAQFRHVPMCKACASWHEGKVGR